MSILSFSEINTIIDNFKKLSEQDKKRCIQLNYTKIIKNYSLFSHLCENENQIESIFLEAFELQDITSMKKITERYNYVPYTTDYSFFHTVIHECCDSSFEKLIFLTDNNCMINIDVFKYDIIILLKEKKYSVIEFLVDIYSKKKEKEECYFLMIQTVLFLCTSEHTSIINKILNVSEEKHILVLLQFIILRTKIFLFLYITNFYLKQKGHIPLLDIDNIPSLNLSLKPFDKMFYLCLQYGYLDSYLKDYFSSPNRFYLSEWLDDEKYLDYLIDNKIITITYSDYFILTNLLKKQKIDLFNKYFSMTKN